MARSVIPAFINPEAGSAAGVRPALEQTGHFQVHEVEPARLHDALRSAIDAGATRVLVAGGDGTICSAASVLVGTPVELAVIPAGTLNHFARYVGIPDDPRAAAEIAMGDTVRMVDVGWVNDHLILNTSSVGAYVTFVRTRERLETHLPYFIASLVAFARILIHLRTFRVVVEIDGRPHVYATPLVFVGVGERELSIPMLGGRIPGGRRGLHVLIVRGKRRAQLLLRGAAVATHGLSTIPHHSQTGLDSFLVDHCRIEMRRPRGNVGVDGEVIPMVAPLEYRIERDALRVVAPSEAG
ncbi:MAG TPA: diacylglycerol kinase family protein [Gemmatimonadaceae bacterium]|nr:diacylglycerol kinase family protein [Gemmatimonadaceae bacterium]